MMKKIKNKIKKGFTLTEMLTAVAIIGVLVVLVFGSIKFATSTANEKILEQKETQIISAARMYVQDHKEQFSESDYTYELLINDLIAANYLSSDYKELEMTSDSCQCHDEAGCIVDPTTSCPISNHIYITSDSSSTNLSVELSKNCDNKKVSVIFYKNDGTTDTINFDTTSSLVSGTCNYKIQMPDSSVYERDGYELLGFSRVANLKYAEYSLGKNYTVIPDDDSIDGDTVTIKLYAITRTMLTGIFDCGDTNVQTKACYIYNTDGSCDIETPICSNDTYENSYYDVWQNDSNENEQKTAQGGTLSMKINTIDDSTANLNTKFSVVKLGNITNYKVEKLKWVNIGEATKHYSLSKLKSISARMEKSEYDCTCPSGYSYSESTKKCVRYKHSRTDTWYKNRYNTEGVPYDTRSCSVTYSYESELSYDTEDGWKKATETFGGGHSSCKTDEAKSEFANYSMEVIKGSVNTKELSSKNATCKYCPQGWTEKSDGYCYNSNANPANLPQYAQVYIDSSNSLSCSFNSSYNSNINTTYFKLGCETVNGETGSYNSSKNICEYKNQFDKYCDGVIKPDKNGKCTYTLKSTSMIISGCSSSSDTIVKDRNVCQRNASYSGCESGYTFNSSTNSCTYISTTSGTVKSYKKVANCDGIGGTLSGSSCVKDATKNTSYTCYSGWSRSGSTCYKYTYKNASKQRAGRNPRCPSGYTYKSYYCWKCPSGYGSLNTSSGQCSKKETTSATSTTSYSCPSGWSYDNKKCYQYANLVNTNTVLSCNSPAVLENGKCIIKTTVTDNTKLIASCPSNYTYNKNTKKCETKAYHCSDSKYVYNSETKECEWTYTQNANSNKTCTVGKKSKNSSGQDVCVLGEVATGCYTFNGASGSYSRSGNSVTCSYNISNSDSNTLTKIYNTYKKNCQIN